MRRFARPARIRGTVLHRWSATGPESLVLSQGAGMEQRLVAEAQEQLGLLTSTQLGGHPARTARRAGLVPVQPRVWAASTQPLGVAEQAEAMSLSRSGVHALLDVSALWKYGLAEEPAMLTVGVPVNGSWSAAPPTRVRRIAPRLLEGRRIKDGCWVVALEVALLQAAAVLNRADLRSAVEQALRERSTTVPRLRARLRRGVKGSAVLRTVVDELVGQSLDGAVRRLVAALEVRGVTGLRTEVRFTDESGASAYADVLDEEADAVLEVDGYLSHAQRDRFRTDRRRDRWMHRVHGLVTLRVDVTEVSDDLNALADELAGLLLARRAQRQQRAG